MMANPLQRLPEQAIVGGPRIRTARATNKERQPALRDVPGDLHCALGDHAHMGAHTLAETRSFGRLPDRDQAPSGPDLKPGVPLAKRASAAGSARRAATGPTTANRNT